MENKKIRIVVEVSKDDYEALCSVKKFTNLSWKDFLIAGAIYVVDKTKLEEKIDNLLNIIESIKQAKQNLN